MITLGVLDDCHASGSGHSSACLGQTTVQLDSSERQLSGSKIRQADADCRNEFNRYRPTPAFASWVSNERFRWNRSPARCQAFWPKCAIIQAVYGCSPLSARLTGNLAIPGQGLACAATGASGSRQASGCWLSAMCQRSPPRAIHCLRPIRITSRLANTAMPSRRCAIRESML